MRCAPFSSWPRLPFTLAKPTLPLYPAALTALMYKQAMLCACLAWFLKFSAPSLPWIFPWCSPYSPCWTVPWYTLHCLPSRTHHIYTLHYYQEMQKVNISGQDLLPDFSKSLPDYLYDAKVLQCPKGISPPPDLLISGLPDWCIFHSSSLLITPVIGWPGDVSTEANSSKSRQTALFICGYLHFN